jgi:TRAP-type C4-dicarboxylate transport system permease small subunit
MLKIMTGGLWKALAFPQKAIMIISSLSILTLIVVQVFLRYVFVKPLMGIEELATMVGFWLYFMGASWGTADRSHIKADLVNAFVKDPKKLVWIKTFTAFLSVCLSLFMTYWGWQYVLWGFQKGQTSSVLLIPMVYSQISIFICALLMDFYFAVEFLDYFGQATGRRPLTVGTEQEERIKETIKESGAEDLVESGNNTNKDSNRNTEE